MPVVNVSRSRVPGFRFPQVVSDERESARLAAEHLLERGFRSLAYCCIPNQPNYQDQMGPTFADAVRQRGATCALLTEWRRIASAAATDPGGAGPLAALAGQAGRHSGLGPRAGAFLARSLCFGRPADSRRGGDRQRRG